MDQKKVGLVVEGGGMRGSYTAGVLDAFIDEEIQFPYVIGVSAGANNATSYLSVQRGRNSRIYTEWVTDKRFLSFSNLFKEGSLFGMNFLFETIPNELDPFDYDSFRNSKSVFKICVTDCHTGEPVYFDTSEERTRSNINNILRASSSLPLISKAVHIDGKNYLDGGIVDPIPLEKSFSDGNTHQVVILTRNADYRKVASKFEQRLSKMFLSKYPNLLKRIEERNEKYNHTIEKIEQLEKEGLVFVFRPQKLLVVDRFEKDTGKLKALYHQGYEETNHEMERFKKWLQAI